MKCRYLGGNLAKIGTWAEFEHVKRIAKGYDSDWLWIGLHDKQTEGKFVWIDGTSQTDGTWNAGEPNGDTSENCAFVKADTVTIFDAPCTMELGFICRYML